MRILTPILGLLLLLSASLKAQDMHFTQYFASPLLVNPALTGHTAGDIRLSGNYRSQWHSVSPNPDITSLGSVDMALMKGKLPKGDAMGIGVILLSDKSNIGGLTNTTRGLSLAYHKALGKDSSQHLSVGVQAAWVHKHLNPLLTFAGMYDSTGTLVYPAPSLFSTDISYLDYNVGINYTRRITARTTAYVGYSCYHLTRPVETFTGNSLHRIHIRQSVQMGGAFDVNKGFALYVNGLYQSQDGAREIMIGGSAGMLLNKRVENRMILYAGGWYRYLNAVVPYVGFEWYKIRLGLSYDFNVSSFESAARQVGAYEISLTKCFSLGKNTGDKWFCPKIY